MSKQSIKTMKFILSLVLVLLVIGGNIIASQTKGFPTILPDEAPVVWYDVATSWVCLILFFTIIVNTDEVGTPAMYFYLIIWGVCIAAVADGVTYAIDRLPEYAGLNMAANTAMFIMYGLVTYFFWLYILAESGTDSAVGSAASAMFLVLNFILNIANLATDNFLYSVVDGAYVEGPFYWVALVYPALQLILAMAVVIKSRNVAKTDKYAMLLFPLGPLVSIGFQAAGQNVLSVSMTDLLSLLIIYGFIYTKRGNALNIDELTGVGSLSGYHARTTELDRIIRTGDFLRFGVMEFDINNLKGTNDTMGHFAGDELIRKCARDIESRFKHSTVYRLGGDEFAVILEGEDFDSARSIMDGMEDSNVLYAYGLAVYEPENDGSVHDVQLRADRAMYDNKEIIKKMRAQSDENQAFHLPDENEEEARVEDESDA